jgi:hypothetical protein
MFEITAQDRSTGLVVVEDIDFGLRYEFLLLGFVKVKIVDEYDLVFTRADGTTKKVAILER